MRSECRQEVPYLPAALDRVAASTAGNRGRRSTEVEIEGSEKILLVDDNEEFREATQRPCSRGSATASPRPPTVSRRSTISAADPEIELVLSDVVMPGLSGTELVERLRRAARRQGDLDVGLRRARHQPSRSRGRADAHFIKKQFSSTSLARTIREVLDRPQRSPGLTFIRPDRAAQPVHLAVHVRPNTLAIEHGW